jgi:hypothetical protein
MPKTFGKSHAQPAKNIKSPSSSGSRVNLTPEDVGILVTAGKLRPLGRPNTNAVKFFSGVELMALLADREWLDEVTKTISQFWKRKNASRNGVTVQNPIH